MSNELLNKVKAAKNPEELKDIMISSGIEGFSDDVAKKYFEYMTMRSGELSDDELESAVGGCNTYGHPTVTCDKNCNCGKWEQGFRYDYEDGDYWPLRLDNQALRSVWHALTVNYRDGHKCGNCRHLGFNSIGTGFCEEQ